MANSICFSAILAYTVLITASTSCDAAEPGNYAIITDAKISNESDPYLQAVNALATLRNTQNILSLKNHGLGQLRKHLRKTAPDYVAFVVRPERIEDNFVGKIFQIMTSLDDDPYIDCPYGYITGANALDALRLIANTAEAEKNPERIPKKFVAIAHTFAENDLAPFASQECERYKAYGYVTAAINPVDNSREWLDKADSEIQKLNGASLVFLAGHGMGDMSCAIEGHKFGQVKLSSAIIVNGTCHSAVTKLRNDSKDFRWTIKTSRIDPAESVPLNFIKAGAIGQFASTASSSWSNVVYTTERFFKQGKSLGQALQESLNDKIRSAQIEKVNIITFRNGKKSPQALGGDENPGGIQSISRVILIGDPAYRPFPKAASAVSTL